MNHSMGDELYELCKTLFPVFRSLTGNGVRETLDIIDSYLEDCGYRINRMEFPTGEKVLDWVIPKEWIIRKAYVENEKKVRIIDCKQNNLHVVGYSTPVDKWVDLEEFKNYVYVEKDQEDVIPYVTSYYKEQFGFCMSKNQLDALPSGKYHMYIDSELVDGNILIGEVVIPGQTEKEVFFSTYTCHPSMCNDNVSGMVLSSALIKYISAMDTRKYTYRFVFIPETIGSITYISKNLSHMKERMVAGFNLSCVGDSNIYSMVPTINGGTLSDRVLSCVIKNKEPHIIYPYLRRSSDERQYNMPGVDLPVVAFCRSKYGEFPEYHTSADNLDFVSADGFQGSYDVMTECIFGIENNNYYKSSILCEPQLGRRGLYPQISHKEHYHDAQILCDILAYMNGHRDVIGICDEIGASIKDVMQCINLLECNGIIYPIKSEDDC